MATVDELLKFSRWLQSIGDQVKTDPKSAALDYARGAAGGVADLADFVRGGTIPGSNVQPLGWGDSLRKALGATGSAVEDAGNLLGMPTPAGAAMKAGALAKGWGAPLVAALGGISDVSKSARAAKNIKTTGIGNIDWLSMSPLQRQQNALRDIHLKQMPDGYYVGSPGISTPAALGAMRKRLRDEVKTIIDKPWVKEYGPWYERQREGVTMVTGNDPVKQHNLATGIGIYSPQNQPAPNYTMAANQMSHQAFTGDPGLQVRTAAARKNYEKQLSGAGEADQGPKTGPFSRSSDPTRADPDMATNDIWVGRFLGYAGEDGRPFERGFGAAEHAFVQGELQRLTAIANKEKWGGKSDWHVEELQALPWVEYKAKSLVERSGGKLSYDDAIKKAMVTTKESVDRNTAFLNNEMIGGKAANNVPGMITASPELKLAYTQEPGNFLNAEGRNVFTQSLPNSLEQTAVPYQATYVNSAGQQEVGPGIAFRPTIVRETMDKAGQWRMSDESRNALQVQQAMHGLFNAQEGSVGNIFFPADASTLGGAINAAQVQMPGHLTHSDLFDLQQRLAPYGMPNAVHLGDGRALVTQFDGDGLQPTLGTQKLQRAVAEALPEGAKLQPGIRDSIPGVWLDQEWAQPPGSGAVTSKVLGIIDAQPDQGRWLLSQYDKNPDVLEHIQGGGIRDDKYARITGTPARADLQKLRDDIVNKFGGLAPFFDYVRKNGAAGYPVAFGLTLPDWEKERQRY